MTPGLYIFRFNSIFGGGLLTVIWSYVQSSNARVYDVFGMSCYDDSPRWYVVSADSWKRLF